MMNFDTFQDEAFESVLDDLRGLARAYPDARSALIRLLRTVRDLVEHLKPDTAPP